MKSIQRPILIGGLVAGLLDLADAFLFFGWRGVAPIRILQAIASGIEGRSAFQGGYRSAAFGLLLHFVIATGAAAVYVIASRKLTTLRERPIESGLFYGLLVYAVMNLLVLPLSATTPGSYPPAVLINGILIHLLGVGLPIALIARMFGPERAPMLR